MKHALYRNSARSAPTGAPRIKAVLHGDNPPRAPVTHTFRYAVATVCAYFSLVGLLHASPPPAEDRITILTPEAMPYQADASAPDILVAVVSGDPRSGFYTLRVKFPPGIKTPPHYHPDTRTVTVISGKYYFSTGADFDAAGMQGYDPGTVIVIPAGKPHFSWARDGEVIVQEAGVGPTGVTRTSPPSP